MLFRFVEWLRESRVRMIGAGAAAALVVVIIIAVVAMGGDGEPEIDYSAALAVPIAPGLTEEEVDERVQQTIAAQAPTDTPEPTVDVPATLVAAEEAARATRAATTGGVNSPGFAPTASPAESAGAHRYGLSETDKRYLSGLGLPVWFSTRIHLEMQRMFRLHQREFVNTDEARRVLEWMEVDVDRALREVKSLDSLRGSLSPEVRSYGVYVEELILLNRDAVSKFRTMYHGANEEEGLVYDDLTDAARSEIDNVYFDVKELLRDYQRGMQRYGCSVCGELYRGKYESAG